MSVHLRRLTAERANAAEQGAVPRTDEPQGRCVRGSPVLREGSRPESNPAADVKIAAMWGWQSLKGERARLVMTQVELARCNGADATLHGAWRMGARERQLGLRAGGLTGSSLPRPRRRVRLSGVCRPSADTSCS